MDQFKELSREQLEEELLHHAELVEMLTTQNGRLNTAVAAMELNLKRAHAKIAAQEQSMMDLVEKQPKTKNEPKER